MKTRPLAVAALGLLIAACSGTPVVFQIVAGDGGGSPAPPSTSASSTGAPAGDGGTTVGSSVVDGGGTDASVESDGGSDDGGADSGPLVCSNADSAPTSDTCFPVGPCASADCNSQPGSIGYVCDYVFVPGPGSSGRRPAIAGCNGAAASGFVAAVFGHCCAPQCVRYSSNDASCGTGKMFACPAEFIDGGSPVLLATPPGSCTFQTFAFGGATHEQSARYCCD